jgi:iron(III) transport system ATP-binding protein
MSCGWRAGGPVQETGEARAASFERVAHAFGATRVLDGIDLELGRGEVLALLGPSGCGKTTLLRIGAGLLAPSCGRVRIAGATVADAAAGRLVPPERRGLGMVFQDYALWPHLSVARNVAFPLEMRRVPRAEIAGRVAAALARVGLAELAERAPGALSGGQQQRVAIARAIVAEPSLVLFDEPLSNLDRELRDQLAGEIGRLLRELGLAALYVTHDQAEAFALADRVAVMRRGRIAQLAAPEELVAAPASPEVAEFLQLGTLARARVDAGRIWLADAGLALPNGAATALPAGWSGQVLLARRALALRPDGAAALEGVVTRSVFRGDHHQLAVRLGAVDPGLEVALAAPARGRPGERVRLAVDARALRFFPTPAASPAIGDHAP